MARKYHQGFFKPQNPEKYVGDAKNCIFRSSWELLAFNRLDADSSVLAWSSEEKIVLYENPLDKRVHRYFLDLWVKRKMPDGQIKEFIIEIKPEAQTKPPVKPKKMTKRYAEEVETYIRNQAKWEAAERYAQKNNMTFEILSERQLGIK